MGYSTKTNGFDQNHVAGYALDNLAIFGPVISPTSRTDALYGMKVYMDDCSTYSATNDSIQNQLHYRSLGVC